MTAGKEQSHEPDPHDEEILELDEATDPEPPGSPALFEADALARVEVPSLLVHVISRFGVTTVGELVALEPDVVAQSKGVGAKKVRLLRALQRDVRTRLAGGSPPPPSPGTPGNTWALVRPDARWEEVLPRLSNRARNALNAAGVHTLGDMQQILANPARLGGVGRKTASEIKQAFHDVTTRGPNYILFGDAEPPRTTDELIERALGEFKERGRGFVVEWRLEGKTLEQIGNDHDLTRERVRQIVSRGLEEATAIYRRCASDILAPELALLERPGNLLVCKDEDEARRLDLALELAGTNPARMGRTLTTTTSDEGRARVRQVRAALEESGKLTMHLDDALELVDEAGIILEPDELLRLLQDNWRVTLTPDGRVVFPWVNLGDVLAEQLRAIGHAADVRAVLERYEEFRAASPGADLPELSDHSGRTHLGYAESVWNYGHGLYIHEDRFPFAREDLDRAVEWAIRRLTGRPDAIGANVLLEEMVAARIVPTGMTPHLIKDGVHRHPQGLTFANTLLVAHAPSFTEDGVSMIDRLVTAVENFGRPASTAAIHAAMKKWGYASTTIYQTLISSPLFVNIGRGRFVTLASLGLDDAFVNALCDAVYERLPGEDIVASRDLLDELPSSIQAGLAKGEDPVRLLEVFVRRDERLDSAPGLVGRASADQNLLQLAVLDVLDELGCAYPREVRASLADAFGEAVVERNVWNALGALSTSGAIAKLPGALYYRSGSEHQVFEAWEHRRDLVLKCATHTELDGHDPHVIWTLVRYIERIVDEDDLATSVIERTLQRSDLPSDVAGNLRDLRFARSMGMG